MKNWLDLGVSPLTEEAEGFLLGRGLPSSYVEEIGIGVWKPPAIKAPGESYRSRYGDCGEGLKGWLSIPLKAPQGRLVGMSYRRWDGRKEIRKFHLPDALLTPIFEGLNSSSLARIWEGGDVWLVEGVFDMALAHITPPGDCVLSCGTARLAKKQALFLHRFLGRSAMVHLVFDEDEAGRKHSGEALNLLDRVGVNARCVHYQGGKDPGEIWEKGGRKALSLAFGF